MKWNVLDNLDYKQYMQDYSVHSLLAKVLVSKDIEEDSINDLLSSRLLYHDFSLFLEGEMAIERINEAIEKDEKICIYGDYDCDGILATTILVQAFKMLGKVVGYHIPNRFEDGYGLNVNRVKQMHERGYNLIITVDNGVKANEAIDLANELGIDVIISDHHGYDELPDACAIVHTKMSPEYPFKEISGGFIAYKIASALLQRHDKYLFSLAAITTVSDMMPLLDENRSLVKRGLQFMSQEKYLQLELLLGENQDYNVRNIGFIIAPKINSFGRLPEMVNPNNLVKFFDKDVDEKFAMAISDAANKINAKRQDLTNKQYLNIKQNFLNDDFLYVYDQDIHEGLVGLIANKYTREFNRPSFVMNFDKKNNVYRGSARSIENAPLNMIFDCAKDNLAQYGGHALAGGFSVDQEHLMKFKDDINEYLANCDLDCEASIDVILVDNHDISLDAVRELSKLEPIGNGNDEPIFLFDNIPVTSFKVLSNGKHMRFDLNINNYTVQALMFNCQDKIAKYQNISTVSIIGSLKINKYLNNEYINIIIQDIK